MAVLVPAFWERLAQSYALRIRAGDISIDDVPAKPDTLIPRVMEIVENVSI